MGYSLLTTLQILSGIGIRAVSAQQLAYTSFAVTECVTETSPMPDPAVGRPAVPPIVNMAPGKSGAVEEYTETITLSYTMPPCTLCGCPGCTVVSSFMTTCLAFNTAGARGMKVQSYAIAETYLGLSSLPTFEQPTQIPYGFTSRVETCDSGACGPEAITATMTYPIGGGPFAGVETPVGGPECYSEGGNDCSTLSTRYEETPETITAAPAPVSAQPTVVTADGNNLRQQHLVVSIFVLLVTIL
ncbi:hypothetical protein GQX73_g8084 [Xylaria multiplex]|uniref:Uncharacterized protein n=1 Tax=Xylaria multiplex TaxID=323545 RepID=A0A7C8ISN8_9PEZI|nr:hypothetical protein GQX73_g8084 [Xylaria multiplex]